MSEIKEEVVTRGDLAIMFKYSTWRAGQLYQAILATIPADKMKREFKTRLPRHFVDAYLAKTNP